MSRGNIPLLSLVVLLVAVAARAEFPVTENRPLAPTLGISHNVKIVATDSGFLAFWKTRTTWDSAGMPQVGRLAPDGELQGRSTLWDLPLFSWSDAASNGDQVLLAGYCNDPSGGAFCAVRISAAGDLIGSTLLPGVEASLTGVASDGVGFLIASERPDGRVLAIPVSSDGIAREPVALGAWNRGESASAWISVAAIGDAYVAAFGPAIGHVLTRVSASGAVSSVPLDPPFELARAIIEASGDLLLVLAMPKAPVGDPRMRAAIFDRDLARRSEWIPLDGSWQVADVVPTSSGWIVGKWMLGPAGATGASLVAISRDGFVGQPTSMPDVNGWLVDLAGRDDRAALVWTTQNGYRIPRYLGNEVRVGMFDPAAAPARETATISLGPAPQVDPAAAHGGGATLVAWTERVLDGAFVVKARPFDPGGAPLSPAVTMPFAGTNQSGPHVAWGDGSFLLTWSESSSQGTAARAARVTPDGRLLDAGAIPVAAAGGAEDVAWNGSSWVVVSAAGRPAATRISPAGVALDPTPVPIAHLPAEWGAGKSAIDCSGTGCLVAWESHPPFVCRFDPCIPPEPEIDATRIAPDLTLLDPLPLRLTEDETVTALAVSWNETVDAWLVSWSLNGRHRISGAGVLLEPVERRMEYGGYQGFVSTIPERDGWRIAWTPDWLPVRYSSELGADAFHGWSATGTVAEIEERRSIAATPEREWSPLLVAAPRPAAFFLRESQISAGSPQVLGRFLDETEVVPTNIVATATRLDDQTMRVSWTSDIPGVKRFTVLRFDDRYEIYWYKVWLGPSARSFDFYLPAGRAGQFVVRADTTMGPIESNVAVVRGNRNRFAVRKP